MPRRARGYDPSVGTASDTSERRSPLRVELNVLARAVGGAMFFGVPLLFTMEMWWIGEVSSRPALIGFVAVALLINIALARMSGFRDEGATFGSDVAQAIEAIGVAIVLSLAVLGALGRLDSGASLESALGMMAVQVVPLSLGAMIANLVFAPGSGRARDGGDGDDGPGRGSPIKELVNDVGATFAGALFIGFAIAPTEEVPMLASGLNLWNLFGVIALSVVAGYVIVFASGFDPSHHEPHQGGLFQRPFSETILAYVVSIVAATCMLVGFGQVAVGDPPLAALTKVLVLAVPASIGGAAGRVVV